MSSTGYSADVTFIFTTLSIASLVCIVLWHHARVSFLGSETSIEAQSPPVKAVPPEESNLRDEFTCTAEGERPESWRVKSLWIYPVKSCRGIELNESKVVSTGLEYDRQFTLAEWKADPKTAQERWIIITLRQYPLLARIRTAIEGTRGGAGGVTLCIGYPVRTWMNRWLAVGDEVLETFRVPLDADERKLEKYPLESVRIWNETVQAYNMSTLLPPHFGIEFGAKGGIALFRMPPSKPREVFGCAPEKDQLGHQPVTAFADRYPIHLMNIASVRDLNSKIADTIPTLSVLRFRPNIIVAGPPAYEEDVWKRVSIGEHEYYTVCRTVRCKLPNVDPSTGERHAAEPDRAMRKYRRIGAGSKVLACMGMQVVPAEEVGVIRVGDSVTVIETGEHCCIDE